jgi:hypothetical protein
MYAARAVLPSSALSPRRWRPATDTAKLVFPDMFESVYQ